MPIAGFARGQHLMNQPLSPPARLFIGRVMHRRLRPVGNRFVYPVFYVQISLRALGRCRARVFSLDRFNLLSLRQRDYGARDDTPLLPWVERTLAAHGLRADGDIRLQTFPRVLGYAFNPVSFFLCHRADGNLVAVIAEVNNTFGGHHHYLISHPDGAAIRSGDVLNTEKALHVSPFCRPEGKYAFRFHSSPGISLVRIEYADGAGDLIHTAISGEEAAWSDQALLSALARMPLLTLGVSLRIHWQALRLWRLGVPFHGVRPAPQPQTQESSS